MSDVPEPVARQWEPIPARFRVGIFRFPYGMQEMSTTVDWLARTNHYLGNHPRIEAVATEAIADTPVDMSRNRALKRAKELGLHFAIFVDSDMWPDYGFVANQSQETEEHKEFVPGALEFALKHDGPCVIAAPYCSAPPEERVLVMKWVTTENGAAPGVSKITSYSREEVSNLRGFGECAALGTGLIMIDTRILDFLPTPYFSYQWKDKEQTEKSSTEDIVFTRDLHCLGIPQYCYWSAWAGHWKLKMVGKPATIPLMSIPKAMREVLWRDFEKKMNNQHGAKFERLAFLERIVKEEGLKV